MPDRPPLDPGAIIYDALKDAGVDLVVYLPDSTTYPIQKRAEDDPGMMTVSCAREDEGMAIAMGAACAGSKAAVVIDGAGLGFSAFVLAGCVERRTPFLILSSHNEVLGEANDHNSTGRAVSESVYQAVRVPYTVMTRVEDAPMVIRESMRTAMGQRVPVGIAIAPFVMGG